MDSICSRDLKLPLESCKCIENRSTLRLIPSLIVSHEASQLSALHVDYCDNVIEVEETHELCLCMDAARLCAVLFPRH